MTDRQVERDDGSHRVTEHADGLGEERRDGVGIRREAVSRRRRRRAAVPGQVGDDERPRAEQRHELREVPGGACDAVEEQERPPLAVAVEGPEPHPADLVEPLLEARQKIGRVRHPDRLSFAR